MITLLDELLMTEAPLRGAGMFACAKERQPGWPVHARLDDKIALKQS